MIELFLKGREKVNARGTDGKLAKLTDATLENIEEESYHHHALRPLRCD